MTATADQEIAYYVDRVRAALADLPPAVRDELLEDLPEHLTEVAAEAGGSLTDRLGPPEAYAAELRVAAGIEVPTAAPNLDQRIGAVLVAARSRLRVADVRLGPVIGYVRASEFIRLLRPAWWVLRGYLVAMFVSVVLSGQQFGLLPRLGGSTLAALMLLSLTVLWSIWLGRRSAGFTRWPKWILNISTALIVLFGLIRFVDIDGQAGSDGYYEQTSVNNPYSSVQDVFVYDGQGRLVENARLFDQNGQPIRLGYPGCQEAQQRTGDAALRGYPYCPQQAPFQFGTPSATPPAASPSPGETPGTPEPTAGSPSPTPPGPSATPGPASTPTARPLDPAPPS
jgi:uncharacterized membrane protein